MIDHGLERRRAAVVEVRRRQRDVAQGRRAEAAHVARIVRDLDQAGVGRGICADPVDVVEPGVEELDLAAVRHRSVVVRRREVEAAVTLPAAEARRLE